MRGWARSAPRSGTLTLTLTLTLALTLTLTSARPALRRQQRLSLILTLTLTLTLALALTRYGLLSAGSSDQLWARLHAAWADTPGALLQLVLLFSLLSAVSTTP